VENKSPLGLVPQLPDSSQPRLLRRREASHYLMKRWGIPCSYRTLAKLACIGGGPEHFAAGRTPLYAREDLDSWALAKLGVKRKSTSDARAIAASRKGARP